MLNVPIKCINTETKKYKHDKLDDYFGAENYVFTILHVFTFVIETSGCVDPSDNESSKVCRYINKPYLDLAIISGLVDAAKLFEGLRVSHILSQQQSWSTV